jgi:hypothetical protein
MLSRINRPFPVILMIGYVIALPAGARSKDAQKIRLQQDAVAIVAAARNGPLTEQTSPAVKDLWQSGDAGLEAIEPYASDSNPSVRRIVLSIAWHSHTVHSAQLQAGMVDDVDSLVSHEAIDGLYCYSSEQIQSLDPAQAIFHLSPLLMRPSVDYRSVMILSSFRNNSDALKALHGLQSRESAAKNEAPKPRRYSDQQPVEWGFGIGSPRVDGSIALDLGLSNAGDAEASERIAALIPTCSQNVRNFFLWNIDWISSRRVLLALLALGDDMTPVHVNFDPIVSVPSAPRIRLADDVETPQPVFRVRDLVLIPLAGKYNVKVGVPDLDTLLAERRKNAWYCHHLVDFRRPLTDSEAKSVARAVRGAIMRSTKADS